MRRIVLLEPTQLQLQSAEPPVPVPGDALVRADSLSVDQMAMVENQSIGAHAVRRAQIQPGETALVIGAGPIGFGVAQFARLAGAEVLVADLSATRLEMARRWLAPR